ncbi:MAG: cyclic nucleotide-binding domain-containing protein [Nitrospinae bacterium]|nr:cyclic nucleotide-binding domain-containing protein [Nitrospinota bacterium]MZH14385.1 cyclic nucleotide-binding domain-containing protein [Nitrospinota bacterium]
MNINTKVVEKEDLHWFLAQMKKVNAFSILPNQDLMHLVSKMRGFEFKAGTTIVNQGESANLFFIVQKGEVEVSVRKFFFRKKKVAILKSGDFFGESVLVGNSRRIATVTTKTDATCFVLLKPTFRAMMDQNPLFTENMKAVFLKRKKQLKNA